MNTECSFKALSYALSYLNRQIVLTRTMQVNILNDLKDLWPSDWKIIQHQEEEHQLEVTLFDWEHSDALILRRLRNLLSCPPSFWCASVSVFFYLYIVLSLYLFSSNYFQVLQQTDLALACNLWCSPSSFLLTCIDSTA